MRMRSFGGTAACDWVTREAADIGTDHPDLVALQFSGNSFTSCMRDASGAQLAYESDAYFAAYRDAITTLVTQAAQTGARVVWISSPLMRGGTDANRTAFAADAIDAGQAFPGLVTVVDAGAAVMDNGQYTDTLPCLTPDEVACTGGMVPVRAADGVHFWFVDDNTANYSPGAYRFADSIAAAVTNP